MNRVNKNACTFPSGLLLLALSLCVKPTAPAQSVQPVQMATYAVSFPRGWYVERQDNANRVVACNKRNGDCWEPRGGLPKRGTVTVALMPADIDAEHKHYKNLDELMASVHVRPTTAVPIREVTLGQKQGSIPKRCLLLRSTIGEEVWSDFYGCQIGRRLFRAVVQYADGHKKSKTYRAAIIAILSSLNARQPSARD